MNNEIQTAMVTLSKLDKVKNVIDSRFAALDADLGLYIASWSKTLDERKVLADVAKELREFLVERQKNIKTLQVDNTSVRQSHIKNSLLTFYINNALVDWQDIKRAGEQRDFYTGRTDKNPLQTLRRATQLANLSLERAEKAELIANPPTPICYFEKNIAITEAPYTTVPLISVPLTAIGIDMDLYGVVHEIGHYVFTYLNTSIQDEIAEELKKDKYNKPYHDGEEAKDSQVSNWAEEMFADLFASLVGGKEFDEQFADFLLGRAALLQNIPVPNWKPVNEFLRDDQDHPPIFLRPIIAKDNPKWEQTVSNILSGTLSAEESKQFTALQNLIRKDGAKGAARELGEFMASKIIKVSNDPPIDFPVGEYTGAFDYTPKTEFTPLSNLADFTTELQGWHKDEYPVILRCCPP